MICQNCQHERFIDDNDVSMSSLICPNCKMPYKKKPTDPEVLAKLRAERLALKPKQKTKAQSKPAPKPKVIKDPKNNTGGLEILVTVVMVIFLIRCQMQDPEPISPEVKEANYIDRQQNLIKSTLKDPDSAKFQNSFVSNLIGAPIVCGYVNAKNSFGGYTGFERFISGGSIQVLESQMAKGEMSKSWATLCGSKN
ncbi:hypothetical protein [Methylobacter sp.]|uniref:hypothetical protein n=2 Tax=Methylobacter sp. TaxID=2051955 RepID=UPI002FDE0324